MCPVCFVTYVPGPYLAEPRTRTFYEDEDEDVYEDEYMHEDGDAHAHEHADESERRTHPSARRRGAASW
jgi:hypothetical protein